MKTDEMNGCGNCTKLRWNRKRLGLTQKEFAEKVGLHVLTIRKLERDETAWATLKDSTVDKIASFYEGMASWQPERPDKVIQEINDVIEEPYGGEEVIIEPAPVIEQMKPIKIVDNLHKKDEKTLTLIEFAYEEITQAETHEDFVIAIQMLKKIVNKY